jgi:hypothetical protein
MVHVRKSRVAIEDREAARGLLSKLGKEDPEAIAEALGIPLRNAAVIKCRWKGEDVKTLPNATTVEKLKDKSLI